MNRGTKRSVIGTGQSVSRVQWWEEDLDDIIDILRQEISDTTHVSQTSLNNGLQTFPTLPVHIASQFDFPIFPTAHHLELDEIDPRKVEGDAPTANIADNINQPSEITSVQTSPCVMDGTVFGGETSSPENSFDLKCFSRENQSKLLLQYSEKEKNANASQIRIPTSSSIQSPNKLFGILSLILQALNGPLTEELEECYTGALQRALVEIQSAVEMYSSLCDPGSVENQYTTHSV